MATKRDSVLLGGPAVLSVQLWILWRCFIICYKHWSYDFYWRHLYLQESKTIVLLQQLKQVLVKYCRTFVALFYFYFCLFCINYFCLKGIWPFKMIFENFAALTGAASQHWAKTKLQSWAMLKGWHVRCLAAVCKTVVHCALSAPVQATEIEAGADLRPSRSQRSSPNILPNPSLTGRVHVIPFNSSLSGNVTYCLPLCIGNEQGSLFDKDQQTHWIRHKQRLKLQKL